MYNNGVDQTFAIVIDTPKWLNWTKKYTSDLANKFGNICIVTLFLFGRVNFYRNGERVDFVTFMETLENQRL